MNPSRITQARPANGDSACPTAEEWGESHKDLLPAFKHVEIDAALLEVTEKLKHTEHELLRHTRKVAQVEEDPSDIVARSPAMQRVMALARTIAKEDSTVPITGESEIPLAMQVKLRAPPGLRL